MISKLNLKKIIRNEDKDFMCQSVYHCAFTVWKKNRNNLNVQQQ